MVGCGDNVTVPAHICGPVRSYRVPARQQFAGVLEHDDAIAKQAPALLGVADKSPGRLTIQRSRVGAERRMRAHACASWSISGCGVDHMLVCRLYPARDIVSCDDLSRHSLLLVPTSIRDPTHVIGHANRVSASHIRIGRPDPVTELYLRLHRTAGSQARARPIR